VIRRVQVAWPDPRPFRGRSRRSFRLLAVSDLPDAALRHERNRLALGSLDLICGCGDLEPDELAFLADAFGKPLVFVRGNHDRGLGWAAANHLLPEEMPTGPIAVDGLPMAGLPWPGRADGPAQHDEGRAWLQAARLALHRFPSGPPVVLSHVPPRGMGDAADHYHTGFSGYRWLVERIRPPLWLHGHTPVDPGRPWYETHSGTVFVNVTGAVVIEIVPG
jgi:hypothetical protein